MKLLHCKACGDIRALRPGEWATCWCGDSRGRYIDGRNVVLDGANAQPLGIANATFVEARRREANDRSEGTKRYRGHTFSAFVIPWSVPTVRSRTDTEIAEGDPIMWEPQQCPCGRTFVRGNHEGPVPCECGDFSLDLHSTGGGRWLQRRDG